RPVADRVRRGPPAARPAAARRRGGARRRVPGRGDRLWRRVARHRHVLLGCVPLDRDLGALRARPVAVLLHPVADDRQRHRAGLRTERDHLARPVCRHPGIRDRHAAALAGHAVQRGAARIAQSRDAHARLHAADSAAWRHHRRAAAARPELAADLAAGHRPDRRHDRGVRRGLRDLPARGSARLKDWTASAALNNARWCDAVCRAHGVPGRFLEHSWVNAAEVPRFYPNAVTLKDGDADRAEQLAAIEILKSSNLPGRWAVKDSFDALDALGRRGFDVLLEAAWIRNVMPLQGPASDITWTRAAKG